MRSFLNDKTDLYIIRAGNFYKIGITNNINKRIDGFFSYCPLEIEIIYRHTFEIRKNAAEIENCLHKEFSKKNVRGEWFLLTQEDIEKITSIYKNDLEKNGFSFLEKI